MVKLAIMLRELLKDWQDFDGAMHAIAVSLGLMPNDWAWVLDGRKWILWSNNPYGNMLSSMLTSLVAEGIVEENDDQKFRFNASYVPPWERPQSS
jgi:hypothetical protein